MTAMRDVPLCEHRVTNNLLAIVARGPHARMTVDEWERTANLQPGTLKAMRDGRCNSLDLANIAECERVDVLEILNGNDGRAWSKSLNESVQYLRGKIESLRIRLLDSATLASSIERAPRLMLRRMLLKQHDLDRRIRALTIKMDETTSPAMMLFITATGLHADRFVFLESEDGSGAADGWRASSLGFLTMMGKFQAGSSSVAELAEDLGVRPVFAQVWIDSGWLLLDSLGNIVTTASERYIVTSKALNLFEADPANGDLF